MASPKDLATLDDTEKKVVHFLATSLENGRATLETTELTDFLNGVKAAQRLVSIVARLEGLGLLIECVPQPAPALKKAATRNNPETYSLIMHQRTQYVGWKISGSVLDMVGPITPVLDDDEAEVTKPTGGKRKPTVNDRMKAELAANLETVKGWTARQWAIKLGCAKSTVIESTTWRSLHLMRHQDRAERRNDRRRK